MRTEPDFSLTTEFDDDLFITIRASELSEKENSFMLYQLMRPKHKGMLGKKKNFKVAVTPRVPDRFPENKLKIEISIGNSNVDINKHTKWISTTIESRGGYIIIGENIIPWFMSHYDGIAIHKRMVTMLQDFVIVPIGEDTNFTFDRYFDQKGNIIFVRIEEIRDSAKTDENK